MSNPALTRTERELLGTVRVHGTIGPCHLSSGARGRTALVVPERLPTNEYGGKRIRWRAYNWRTVWHLEQRGLVTIGAFETIPDYEQQFSRLPAHVRRFESLDGRPITITPSGETILANWRQQ